MSPAAAVILAVLALPCALVLVGALVLGVALLIVGTAIRIAEWIDRWRG